VDAVPWAALVTLALVGLASQRIKEMPELPHGEPHAPPPSVRALLMRRDVQAFFVSTFLMLAAHSAIYSFYSLYLEQIGYSKTVIGMMWSLGVLAEIAFFYFQAPLFRYFGVRSMMLASLLLAVVRFAMIGTGAGSLLVLLAAQLLHGATFGIHNSASVATLQRWFAGPLQARGQALFASLSYGLGGTLGSLAMSVVWDGIGASAVFLLASGLALGGLLAAWLSYRWQDAYVAR
jgi:PPP family 3-phenylpropionic acid transporter